MCYIFNCNNNINLIEDIERISCYMAKFFRIYKRTRKSYIIFICIFFIIFLCEIGILVREGYIYNKYGSSELLEWFDYGNGDINFDGVTNEDDYKLLENAVRPYLTSDGNCDQTGVNYLLEENVKYYLNVNKFDEYLLKRMRNRADCNKDAGSTQIINNDDLSSLKKLIK